MTSYCVAEDSPLVAYGSAWHMVKKTNCIGCGTPFCSSCWHGCPRCHLGEYVERREDVRQAISSSVVVQPEEGI